LKSPLQVGFRHDSNDSNDIGSGKPDDFLPGSELLA